MDKGRIKFYISRLKTASLPELIYRARQVFFAWQVKALLKRAENLLDGLSANLEAAVSLASLKELKLPLFHHQVSEEMIQQIIEGKLFTLNAEAQKLLEYERRYSLLFLPRIDSKEIDSEEQAPDLRAVWEPARLQHITILIAYALTEPDSPLCPEAKQFAQNAALAWIRDHPFPLGVHYLSAMECGLRLPVFLYCLKALEDLLAPAEFRLILEAIYLHAWWIERRLSLYSSLGNHTVAESLGLVFAGLVFQKTPEGQKWLERGFRLLEQEAYHQILNDGGPIEQSLHYHRFVLDLFWLAVDFLERNTAAYDCRRIRERLELGEDFCSTFTDSGRLAAPSIGDSDGGFAVAPGVFVACSRPHLNPQPATGPYSCSSYCRIFPDSGYSVIRSKSGAIFTFDHGPLGMPPLYNHGHADALSITLSKNGQQLVVDPGTYRYSGSATWRRYFKGTRAHNTVTIDGQDQATQETSFIWSRPYEARLLEYQKQADDLLLIADHTGYLRLSEPVRHRRSILFFDHNSFIIKDAFSGGGIHEFELNYHLHPKAWAKQWPDSPDEGWWQIATPDGQSILIRLMGADDFQLRFAQDSSPLGWYSAGYGLREKSSLLSCTKKGAPDEVFFITVISTELNTPASYKLDRMVANI